MKHAQGKYTEDYRKISSLRGSDGENGRRGFMKRDLHGIWCLGKG
jgi:hypothetical protein